MNRQLIIDFNDDLKLLNSSLKEFLRRSLSKDDLKTILALSKSVQRDMPKVMAEIELMSK